MSQSGFTPIQLFRTSTAAAVPTAGTLAAGELAINLTDEKLYFKNAAGVVKLLASNSGALGTVTSVDVSGGTTGLTTSGGPITSSGTITLAGTLGVANGGTGTNTAFTAGSVVFAGASGVYSQDNANLFWDNANDRLGIGTATPSEKLTAYNGTSRTLIRTASDLNFSGAYLGTATSSNRGASLELVGHIDASNSNSWRLLTGQDITGGPDFVISNAPSAASYAALSYTERMRINTSGNVGIGTASPGFRLDVRGSTGALLNVSDNSQNILLGTVATGGGYIETGLFTQFVVNGSERMRIDSSGNVGIGTTSTLAKLHVAANATYQQYLTGTDINQQLRLGYDTTNNVGKIQSVQVGVGFKDLVLQPEGGNVGIGTAAPGTKLDVVGPDNSGAQYRTSTRTIGIGSISGVNALYGGSGTELTFHIGSERMRIDSSGNVGIGTNSPGTKLTVAGASEAIRMANATPYLSFYNAAQSTRFGYIQHNGTNLALVNGEAGSLEMYTSNALRATITSAGDVGIGTTSYGGKLTIIPTANPTTASASTNQIAIGEASNNTAYRLNIGYIFTGGYAGSIQSIAGGVPAYLLLNADGGNVGIGTSSPSEKLHVVSASNYPGYFRSSTATAGVLIGGVSSAGAVTSDSSGTPLTFGIGGTERVRIDIAGNVGIGTSSPTAKLQVAGTVIIQNSNAYDELTFSGTEFTNIYSQTTSGMQLGTTASSHLALVTNNAERMRIDSAGNVGIGVASPAERLDVAGNAKISSGSSFYWGDATSQITAVNSGAMRFLVGNGGEKVRIDATGNVGIGTSSPSGKFNISAPGLGQISYFFGGTSVNYTDVDTNIFRSAAGSERMRIDASGNLLVGTTSASTSSSSGVKVLPAEGGANNPQLSIVTSASTATTASLAIYSTGASALRFYVDNGGTIYATNTSISAISDQRFKENVRDLDTGLDTILALKPRRFDWKEGKGKDVKDDMGFIAQEIETVLPALVGGWKAGEGEPDDLKSVKAGDLIPVLVKAIQELTARVAQLEGN